MRHAVILGIIGLLAVARPAEACTIAIDSTALRTVPMQGEQHVPTDVAILVDLSLMYWDTFEELPSGLCTLRTQDGEVVPSATERAAVWHAQVRPLAALAANTTYVLEVQIPINADSIVSRTASFTTGTGPLDIELSPPVAAMQHWLFSPDVSLSSCDFGRMGTCLAIPTGGVVEATFLLPDRTDASGGTYLYDGPFTANMTENPGHPYRCMRLRQRAINGTYSEPTVLCAADAPTVELSGNSSLICSPGGILHTDTPTTPRLPNTIDSDVTGSTNVVSAPEADGAEQSASAQGCAMVARSPARTSFGVLVGLSLLALRRRRNPRAR